MPAEFDLASVEQGVLGTRFEGRVKHFASVDSTNQLALYAAQGGAQWGAWVADEQTAGRGRGGHSWHSAPGDGIYLSALVTPWVPMNLARNLPLLAGLAVKAAVLECTGLELDLRWPNDLMFGDKKCGGVLAESASEVSGDGGEPKLKYAVIGIGLNVGHASFPAELKAVATSLYLESGRLFEREPLVASTLRFLDEEVKVLRRDFIGLHGGSPLYKRFTANSTWVWDKWVTVDEGGGYTGRTRGLDSNGFLTVEDRDGVVHTVLSGGVRSA